MTPAQIANGVKIRNALIKRAQKGEKVSAKTAAKQHARAAKEKELGAKIIALPTKKYGVILEDFEWDHQTWSEKGKDRHAANHYPTSSTAHTAKEIFEQTKDRFKCAADDCVLFMWTTEPMLDVAIDVLRLRGFTYKTTVMWDKVVDGTGYWFTNRHEQMLVGVRGKVPAPAPGTQWSSIITERKGKHSVKPEKSYQMIEEYFSNTPKIELNARKARINWDRWGFEAPVKEAAE
jgi:N6-adenosine-specific RNA methylase IME4